MSLEGESGLAIASPAIVVAIALVVARIGMLAIHRHAVEHVAAGTIRPAARSIALPWFLGGVIAPLLLTILLCAMTVGWAPAPAPAEALFLVLVTRGLAIHFVRPSTVHALVEAGALIVLFVAATGPARLASMLAVGVLILARQFPRRPRRVG